MKFGVVIGDSIAEGHPAYHSRLHTISGNMDLSKCNEEGQISYYLEKLTGFEVYNNGIGSQTTEQIKQRWQRDALGMACSELNPAATLPGKPEFIVLCAGINDVWQGVPAAEIVNNLKYFINTANSLNISLIVYNIGPHLNMDEKKLACIKEVNSRLCGITDIKADTGIPGAGTAVFDFCSFANDPCNDGKPKQDLFCDEVHPNGAANLQISDIIYNSFEFLRHK